MNNLKIEKVERNVVDYTWSDIKHRGNELHQAIMNKKFPTTSPTIWEDVCGKYFSDNLPAFLHYILNVSDFNEYRNYKYTALLTQAYNQYIELGYIGKPILVDESHGPNPPIDPFYNSHDKAY